MNKKGVEISMNTIIVAAIGLLVLVVLSAVFLGRSKIFSETAGDCETQSGLCAEQCGSEEFGTEEFGIRSTRLSCPEENQVCCLPVKV